MYVYTNIYIYDICCLGWSWDGSVMVMGWLWDGSGLALVVVDG